MRILGLILVINVGIRIERIELCETKIKGSQKQ